MSFSILALLVSNLDYNLLVIQIVRHFYTAYTTYYIKINAKNHLPCPIIYKFLGNVILSDYLCFDKASAEFISFPLFLSLSGKKSNSSTNSVPMPLSGKFASLPYR